MAVIIKKNVLYDITPCSLVYVYRQGRVLSYGIPEYKTLHYHGCQISDPTQFLDISKEVMPLSSDLVLKIEAACSSETSVNFHRTTTLHVPGNYFFMKFFIIQFFVAPLYLFCLTTYCKYREESSK
jgi:hypothetical protein